MCFLPLATIHIFFWNNALSGALEREVLRFLHLPGVRFGGSVFDHFYNFPTLTFTTTSHWDGSAVWR